MEKIKGIVQKINLYNENNGYGIIRIKIDYHDKEMAQYQHLLVSNILGVICTFDRKPYEDEEYIFLGEFVTSNYGIQLKASSFERCIKESKNSIIKYLASDLFPGIGEATATKVYNALGDNALTKIIEDKNSLDKVNITNKQKNILYQNVLLQSKTNQQLFSMIQLGLSNNVANRIIHTLGDDALNILKENPYQLIYEVEGIGFKTADGIAQMLHIEKSNPNRLKAIILYVYGEMIHNSGNTYEYIEDVQKNCYLFTNVEEEILNKDLFIKLLNELKEEKRIIIEDNSLFVPKYYYEEIKVARNIYSFLNNNNNDYSFDKIKSVINKVMEINGITYTLKQQEAIEKALKEPIVIITGGPGTGKSTVIKGIVDCYKAMFKNEEIINEKIALVAPTGRASKRLKEVTGHDACTIHKILGYEGNDYFTVTED